MPNPNAPYVVRHPEGGMLLTLDPAVDYDPADPLVAAYAWAFQPLPRDVVESIPVEQATARPGEKRATRRRASE